VSPFHHGKIQTPLAAAAAPPYLADAIATRSRFAFRNHETGTAIRSRVTRHGGQPDVFSRCRLARFSVV
jgi:hypothetical protein